jgi:hypothetical protein
VEPSISSCSRHIEDPASSSGGSSQNKTLLRGLREGVPAHKGCIDDWEHGSATKAAAAETAAEAAAAAVPNPADLFEAAQAKLEAGRWQRHPWRQLLLGFTDSRLETAYLQYMARACAVHDALGNLVILLVTPIPGIGMDLPATIAAMGWRAALWQRWPDVVWLVLLAMPSAVMLCISPWLMHGRRCVEPCRELCQSTSGSASITNMPLLCCLLCMCWLCSTRGSSHGLQAACKLYVHTCGRAL